MEMTIEEAIKVLEEHHMWTGEPQEIIDVKVENSAMRVAIDTMRKYQKIEDIYYHQSGEALENSLRAVIEDGNE